MRKILLAALALTATMAARAQTFTNVISGSGIPVDRTIIHGVIDYNKDGYEDFLLSLNSPSGYNGRKLKLYKNNGNGTFSDVSTSAAIPDIDSLAGGTEGAGYVAVADFNNDGFKDIITIEAGEHLRVLGGMASGVFQEITGEIFPDISPYTDLNSYNLADINKDGFLDLLFVHKISASAKEVGCFLNKKGTSPGDSYQTLISGFTNNNTPLFQMFDFDADNDLDIFLINPQNDLPWPGWAYYYHAVKTYSNNAGVFSEVPTISPINFCAIAFRPVITDYNQDGNYDVMAGKGDFSPNSPLFLPVLKNLGNGTFENASSALNFSTGSCYQSQPYENDYDLDGDLDYWVGSSGWQGNSCNGSKFFQNNGNQFTDVGQQLGTQVITGVFGGYTGGIQPTWFDFDNDGDQDFFGGADAGSTANCFFFRNGQSSSNKYIKLDLVGCQSGKDAFYARVKIKANGKTFYRIKSVSLGDNIPQSQLLHFGLGNVGIIDSLVVKWPSGQTTVLTNVAVNQTLTVNEDNSCNAVSTNCPDLSGSLLQGLVGYWPFCGNANDESGNGNNGIANQMVWGTDRFGKPNSAAEYNGNIQRAIRVPNPVGATGGQFTFSFWLKASGPYSIYNGIIDAKGSGMYCQMYGPLQQYINNGIYGKLGFSGYLGNNPSTTSVNDSLWHHGVMVVDWPNGNVKIYVDGDLDATRTFAPQTINPWTAIDFGNSFDNLNNPSAAAEGVFGGSLDDIAIWNRAHSPQEITQLYNQGICQQSITVTDTLLIHTGITSYNPIAYQNTLKVWPNPGNQDITIDAGNLSLMQGWKIKISNSLGQEVYPATPINQQQQLLDMSTWGGNGLYLLHLINPQGHITEVKKIVLAP